MNISYQKKTPSSVDFDKILKLFIKIRGNCKAYQNFLSQQGVNTASLVKDIPISDKESYFKQYSLEDKLYDNVKLSDFYMICTSSGSTGVPTLWPRDISKDRASEPGHTNYLNEHFQVLSKRTLIVISFGMGTATAGMMHAQLSWEASRKGNISVITPGTDVKQTVFLVNSLYKHYEQVIFIGYPPLIKEIITFGLSKDLKVSDWNVKIATAGAGVTAKWRQTMAKMIDKNNDLNKIVSFFGCTEAGMLGMETTEVNKIINLCILKPELSEEIFGTKNLPTLVELNIPGKYVEIIEDELVISVDQPVPLCKYNLHDKAAFLKASRIKEVFDKYKIGFNFSNLNKKYLVVYGRIETGKFSIEDFKFALDEIENSQKLLQEFQFKEVVDGKKRVVTLVLYEKNKLSVNQKVKIEDNIKKILNKKTLCEVKYVWKSKKEARGFLSGKLHYYL